MPATASATPRILVFDSGVGGLSILAEIRARLPHCALVYASDNAAFPYGTKSEAVLVERVDKVLHRLLDRHPADIVVVACNSASTLALPRIRSRFSQPIVGVVPAIKPAAALTKNRTIGLLATPGTVARQYTSDLIRDFAPQCRVVSVGSSELVQMAEDHLRGQAADPVAIRPIIEPLFDTTTQSPAPDVIVLACTHFPLLKPALAAAAPRPVTWVDSGAAIARRVRQLLGARAGAGTLPNAPRHLSLFTADTDQVAALAPTLQAFHGGPAEIIDIPW
ncbi:glutamate racemase [Exilibacterium tricleocarpae]|uniref:Glutamate racemase n=1 Tax=Exilibacterium tricleocarpae TaxID=2591008 RepID=A0A545T8C0_9GAMM|nr:glutamate racemase [Exilibacterium tricleocarpae]TQV73449.1 glutamate racemase [Exilibacterium tricleocarpae]